MINFIKRSVADNLLNAAINMQARTHVPVGFVATMDSDKVAQSHVVVMSAQQAKQCEEVLKHARLVILEVLQQDFET